MSSEIKNVLRQELGFRSQTELASELLENKNSLYYYSIKDKKNDEYVSKIHSLKSNLSRSIARRALSSGLEQSLLIIFEKRLRSRGSANPGERAQEIIDMIKERLKPQVSSKLLFCDALIDRQRHANEVMIISTNPIEFISDFKDKHDESKRLIYSTMDTYIQMSYELDKFTTLKKPKYYKYNVPDSDRAQFLWSQIIRHMENYVKENKTDKRIRYLFPEKKKSSLKDCIREEVQKLNERGYIKIYKNRQPIFGMHTVFFDAKSFEPDGFVCLGNENGRLEFRRFSQEQSNEYNNFVVKRIANAGGGEPFWFMKKKEEKKTKSTKGSRSQPEMADTEQQS